MGLVFVLVVLVMASSPMPITEPVPDQQMQQGKGPMVPPVPSENTAIKSPEVVKSENKLVVPPPIEGKKPEDLNVPQALPSEPLTITLSNGEDIVFETELAKTPKEKAIGMMFRGSVPENTAMLFLFDESKERNFWMKNTFVPLDIIFINIDGIVHHIHAEAVPGSLAPVKSNGEVPAVLEISGGEAERFGIKVGDQVESDTLSLYLNQLKAE